MFVLSEMSESYAMSVLSERTESYVIFVLSEKSEVMLQCPRIKLAGQYGNMCIASLPDAPASHSLLHMTHVCLWKNA